MALLKSAFWYGVDIPGLGQVPVNVSAGQRFAILGFAEPAFWLVGLATQAVFVTALAFNPRFQNYVQAQQLRSAENGRRS